MRRQALRWLTIFLVFIVFLSTVLWWSTSVVRYGAARAAGTQEATYVVAGEVRDAQTGRPVSWAKIADVQDDRKPPFFETNADREGNFRLSTLPEPHEVVVSAKGYKPFSIGVGTSWYKWRPIGNQVVKVRLEPE